MNFIQENEKRKQALEEPYNPITGINCAGKRLPLCLRDAPFPTLFLPQQMFELPVIQELAKHKTIAAFFRAQKIKNTPEFFVEFWTLICETRLKYDFEYYAFCKQTILHKYLSQLVP
ncbi:MAG: hypothetical protein LBH19_05505, partial [Dysgonamonadaceae bacterium]|nr:hypothetical protein [Dysgonamonadaceae bacterium]